MRYAVTEDENHATITVEPTTPDGFRVQFVQMPREWVVAYDGWHEHFTSEAAALECFAFGLSEACRLLVERRAGFATRWQAEEWNGAVWVPFSEVVTLAPFSWRRRAEYRRNHLLPSATPASDGRSG